MEVKGEDAKLFKKLLIETFQSFHDFCLCHNIKYYACAGTAIGVVRHKGLIPWDDDIDVCMKRDDYEKFLSLKSSLCDSDYEILDINDKGYYCTFAKYCNKKTSIWEFKCEPIMFGVYVDIFPLDPAVGNYNQVIKQRFEYKNLADKYLLCTIHRSVGDFVKALSSFKIHTAFWYILENYVFPHLGSLVRKRLKKIRLRKYGRGEEYYIIYAGGYGHKDIWMPEWFEDYVMMSFENTEIPMPKGYHEMLTQVYGDYMTPPPPEKRISHHSHYYYNFDRRVSIKEARELLKLNEKA